MIGGVQGVRRALLAAAGAAALLVLTQFLLPGGGGPERGTPAGILFNGLIGGLLNSLIAVGIILIYRSSRIINFAQAALGAAGGVFAYNLAVLNKWPFLLAFVAGLFVSSALGLIVEMGIIRRFFFAPRLVLTVLTIALIGFLQGATGFVNNLPIFPSVEDRTLEEIGGAARVPLPFDDFTFRVGNLPLDFGFSHLLALGLSIVSMIGLALFLKHSRVGVAVRAAAENVERAPLLGINVGVLSMVVWTVAGFLAGMGVILSGVVAGQFSPGATPPALLLTALAAAVIAKMWSLPTAVGMAVGISVLRAAVVWSFEDQVGLVDLGLLIAIVIGLIVQRRQILRSEANEVQSWEAAKEHRSIPKEMLSVTGVRISRIVLLVLGFAFVLVYPLWATPRQTNLGGYIAIVSIVMLSLVVLTGWAGQVSLGQFALVAFGAVVGGALTARLGLSFWLALPIVPLITAGIAVLLGIPALRIKGLFLAVTTFALAFAVRSVLFNERYFAWLLPEGVDRPSFLLFDFQDERSMYYLLIAALVLSIVLVATLRRSRIGRVLIAVRENEPNVQAFGVNVVRMRLAAFAISGFLCGFAGLLLAHHQRAVTGSSFEPQLSLDVFLFAVVGGVGSVTGVILGTAYFALRELLAGNALAAFLVGNAGLLAILYFSPGGLSAIFYGFRDGVLRIVAQRRQMVVPSLFADLDPEAISRKLIPLAEPSSGVGLAAMPYDRRYAASSELYGRAGWVGAAAERPSDEAAALAAAGREEDEEMVRAQPGGMA